MKPTRIKKTNVCSLLPNIKLKQRADTILTELTSIETVITKTSVKMPQCFFKYTSYSIIFLLLLMLQYMQSGWAFCCEIRRTLILYRLHN